MIKNDYCCHTALDAVSPDTSNEARGMQVKPAMTGTVGLPRLAARNDSRKIFLNGTSI